MGADRSEKTTYLDHETLGCKCFYGSQHFLNSTVLLYSRVTNAFDRVYRHGPNAAVAFHRLG